MGFKGGKTYGLTLPVSWGSSQGSEGELFPFYSQAFTHAFPDL